MPVHARGAAQQGLERVEAEAQGDGQTHGGPEGVASAHPVPEREDALGAQAEFPCLARRRGYGGEVFRHRALPQVLHQPLAGDTGIGQGLLGGECLGGDDDERALGIQGIQHAPGMHGIYVGEEMGTQSRAFEGLQRFHHQFGTKMGAADTDVHHIGIASGSVQLSGFWTRIFAVAFGMGVVSGVVMPFQFGTNWSRFSHATANIISPMLAYEGLTAFTLEAGFLGVLLFGRTLVPRWAHFASALLVAAGTLISTFWILVTNSWMQTPAGYKIVDGLFYPTSWTQIIFTASFPYRFAHTV